MTQKTNYCKHFRCRHESRFDVMWRMDVHLTSEGTQQLWTVWVLDDYWLLYKCLFCGCSPLSLIDAPVFHLYSTLWHQTDGNILSSPVAIVTNDKKLVQTLFRYSRRSVLKYPAVFLCVCYRHQQWDPHMDELLSRFIRSHVQKQTLCSCIYRICVCVHSSAHRHLCCMFTVCILSRLTLNTPTSVWCSEAEVLYLT